MKTIPAATFKEQCLALLDEVDPEGIVITKRGKPVAKLVPFDPTLADLKGKYRDKIEVLGDTFGTGRSWEALPGE
ncbi:MAG: type II toxin-antitoxin system Phd/YefM family antitoxin [Hyphomicrobiales bacterium]